jgi:hypothetical protein
LTTRGTKKDKDYFVGLLMDEYIHFLEEVINVHEERNRGKKNGPYVGRVSFDSIVLESQHLIQYQAPNIKRHPKEHTDHHENGHSNGHDNAV